MKTNKQLLLSLTMALAVPFALTSCSDDDNDLTPSQQQDVELAALTEQYLNATVIPTYTLLANGTDTLYHKLDSLRTVAWAGGTITAEAINDVAGVFLRARSNYELSEAFLFGAASDFGIDPHIDSWPLDLDQLRSALLNTATIETLRTDDGTIAGTALGSSVLGFHGIEYVLFRHGKPRTDLNGNDPDLPAVSGKLELTYAAAVAGDLRRSCCQMEVSWNPYASEAHKALVEDLPHAVPGNNLTYAENMLLAGQPGSTYSHRIKALNDILIAGCENIANEVGDVKMGKPKGVSQGEPGRDADYIESPYSQNSREDFTDNIRSIENVIMGGRPELRNESRSIYAYLNARNPELAAELKTKIDQAKAAIQGITYPFVTTVADDTDTTVPAAISACRALDDCLIAVDNYIRSAQ